MYDYFYGQQAELFSFYRVPKVLFTDEKFSNISSDAKLLYGIMLDRMNLSAKNGWVDELGRVYIIFTIEEVKGALGCAEKKAVKLLHVFYGNVILPFIDRFPTDLELYRIMTTKLNEVAQEKEA